MKRHVWSKVCARHRKALDEALPAGCLLGPEIYVACMAEPTQLLLLLLPGPLKFQRPIIAISCNANFRLNRPGVQIASTSSEL